MTGIMNEISAIGSRIIEQALQLSIELAVLTLVVVGALILLRPRSPSVRHLFWCLVLIKPVVALLIASPMTFYGLFDIQSLPDMPSVQTVDAIVDEPVPSGTDLTSPSPEAYVQSHSPDAKAALPSESVSMVNSASSGADMKVSGIGYAFGIGLYLVVVAVLGMRLCAGLRHVRRLKASAVMQRTGPVRRLLDDVLDRMNMKSRVRIALSEDDQGPVLIGCFSSLIVLPASMVRGLSTHQLRFILAHELVHFRRRDNLMLMLQRISEILLFFHPAVWLCGRRLRKEAEAACDEQVLRIMGEAPRYADCLTRVAELRRGMAEGLLLQTFAEPESHLAFRVRQILDRKRGRIHLGINVISVATLVAVMSLGLPSADSPGSYNLERESSILRAIGAEIASSYETGFFSDPMRFVKNDWTLLGCLVRRDVFNTPYARDEARIRQEIDLLFQKLWNNRGWRGSPEFAADFLRIVQLGVSREDPRLNRLLADSHMLDPFSRQPLHQDLVHGLCRLGLTDSEIVGRSLQHYIEITEEELTGLCGRPAELAGRLNMLWAARDAAGTWTVMEKLLKAYERELSRGEGIVQHIWALVDCVANISHPHCDMMADLFLPFVRQLQHMDGGWGRHSYNVFKALHKYDLVDLLRVKPRLEPPGDWQGLISGGETKLSEGGIKSALIEACVDKENHADSAAKKDVTAMLSEWEKKRRTGIKMNSQYVSEGEAEALLPNMEPWLVSRMPNSFIASLSTAMKSLGEDLSYEYLMGVSGTAFRLQLSADWCASSPSAHCGTQTGPGALEALPFEVAYHQAASEDAEGVKRIHDLVRKKIDQAMPVLYGNEEDGLIIGYRKDGTEWLCLHPWHPSGELFVEKKWPWALVTFEGKKEDVSDPRELAVRTMKLALSLADTKEDAAAVYSCGYHAWNQWIDQLDNDLIFAGADDEVKQGRIVGHTWIYHCLMDARLAAAEYLDIVAPLFDERTRNHLKAASNHYRALANEVLGRQDIDALRAMGERRDSGLWSKEMRTRQAAILKEALQYEKSAVEEIRKALETLDEDESTP